MIDKKTIINMMAEKTNSTKVDAEKFLNAFISVIEDSVTSGEGLKLVGTFNVEVKNTNARTCRNPQNGETIEVPAGKTVKVKVSKSLKSLV